MKEEVLKLLKELITQQKKRLLEEATMIVSHVTSDDLLQPNDYPELEQNPLFRYEEGVLAGLQIAESALLARLREPFSS